MLELSEMASDVRDHVVVPDFADVVRHGERIRGRRHATMRTAAAVGVVAASAAGVALVVQPGPAAAYKVEARSGGIVAVKVYAQRDAAGLERRLSELGVRAHVAYLPAGKICQFDRYHEVNTTGRVLLLQDSSVSRSDPNTILELTIDKKAMLSSQSVIIEVAGFDKRDHGGTTLTAVADGPVAACRPTSPPGDHTHGFSPSPSASPGSNPDPSPSSRAKPANTP